MREGLFLYLVCPHAFILQLFSNAMLSAGLLDNPRSLLTSMNKLLTLSLEKH